MIVTELYNGQGLGNQLWCYVVTRIIAEKNGYDFGIMGVHRFKGKEFMTIDFGNTVIGGSGPEGGPPTKLPESITYYYKESQTRHSVSNLDITKSDGSLLSIPDNTKIDGIMQSFEYVKDHRDKISSWLKTSFDKCDDLSPNMCVIHIRGGDFRSSSAMLDADYYTKAMEYMTSYNSEMIFAIVTDDVETSKRILPNIPIFGSSTTNTQDTNKASHHIGGPISIDYCILNKAKNIIMSASSFGWWPVWTNKTNPNVIAPKYWAAYNQSDGYWSCGESAIPGWSYLDRNGNLEIL